MDNRSHCTVLYTPLQMGSEDEESNRKTRNSLPSVTLLTFEKNWNILPFHQPGSTQAAWVRKPDICHCRDLNPRHCLDVSHLSVACRCRGKHLGLDASWTPGPAAHLLLLLKPFRSQMLSMSTQQKWVQ